jgi:hypothetical protein
MDNGSVLSTTTNTHTADSSVLLLFCAMPLEKCENQVIILRFMFHNAVATNTTASARAGEGERRERHKHDTQLISISPLNRKIYLKIIIFGASLFASLAKGRAAQYEKIRHDNAVQRSSYTLPRCKCPCSAALLKIMLDDFIYFLHERA